MPFTPPSARMRQIKQQESIRKSAEAQAQADAQPQPSVEVDVGAMTATVSAGPDGQLGTADDTVEITPKAKPEPKPEPVAAKPVAAKPPVKKPVPAVKKPRPVPKFDVDMTKDQLLKVAKRMKVADLTGRSTKADILKALKKAAKSWK